MLFNEGFRQEFPFENDIDININNTNQNVNTNMNTMGGMGSSCNMDRNPVMEPMRERVVQRTIVHEVPQDCLHYVILYGISFVNVSKTYISAEYRSFLKSN